MGGFQWHAISCSSNWTASLSGFSRAVTAQIKKLLLSPHPPPWKPWRELNCHQLGVSSSWPHSCLGISTLVSEEQQVHGVRQELTRALQGRWQSGLILQIPSPLSCCVLWAERKKRKIQGWESSSSATDLLCCLQARHLIPPCSVASGMGCIQPKGIMREILSIYSSLRVCLALLMLSTSQSSQKWEEERSGAWSPL